MITERRETHAGTPMIVPGCCLESFKDLTQGRGAQTEPEVYLSPVSEAARAAGNDRAEHWSE